MSNGLDIDLKSFEKMKAKDRDVLIYQNVLHTKRKLDNYQTNKKVQYSWLTALTIGMMGIGRMLFRLE